MRTFKTEKMFKAAVIAAMLTVLGFVAGAATAVPEDCDSFCQSSYESDAEISACTGGCLWAVLSLADEMIGAETDREPLVTASEDGVCTYRTAQVAFTFTCPPDTEMQDDPANNSVLFLSSTLSDLEDIFSENINILLEDLSMYGEVTLEDYMNASRSSIEQYISNPVYLLEESFVMNKVPAYRIIYTGELDMGGATYGLKWEQVVTIHNNQAIIITYTSEPGMYEDYRVLLQTIVDSFELI